MSNNIPNPLKIYHIVHLNNLASIIRNGFIFSDAIVRERKLNQMAIGMNKLKERRLVLPVKSHHNLCVGDCVPFYFCPRSVMLYIISTQQHPECSYQEGQEPIVHLVADLNTTWDWADSKGLRCAFTTSNAASYYFEDFKERTELDVINWDAVNNRMWTQCKEEKQAEFLLERQFPWNLVEQIGVYSCQQLDAVTAILNGVTHHPAINIHREWYY